jgi:Ca2+-transporting ATPase
MDITAARPNPGVSISAAANSQGLSEQEAADRLLREGDNELPSAKPKGFVSIAASVVREPMFLLLIGASCIYVVLGDRLDAVVLFASVFVMIGITFFQERKTERALEALRDLSSPRALVLRAGLARRIPGREVVRGDLLILQEGDRVAADARVLSAENLMADESLLTGESAPVRKRADHGGNRDALASEAPGGDDRPFVYSGSLLTSGHGTAVVLATGVHTAIGRIGKALAEVETEKSPLQIETRRAVLIFASLGLLLCAAVVLLYALAYGDWLEGLLAGITIAMANLPEEVPVVLTVFLALGAWRISRHGVLTRRPAAIETLGAATVLCVDKTGTLTQNRMTVRRLWRAGTAIDLDEGAALPPDFAALIETAMLASEPDPFDPMERAFFQAAEAACGRRGAPPGWTIEREYPFTPELPLHAHGWRLSGEPEYVVAAKGAPEAIADVCGLNEEEKRALFAAVEAMASRGMRVLAMARGTRRGPARDWPGSPAQLELRLEGLIGLEDPIRPSVPQAVKECRAAGMRIVMITGDHAVTAEAIGRQVGLDAKDAVLTGHEIDALGDAALAARIRSVNIFARVRPEQKLRLVEAFKAAGEVVAMTGDGVNDAPALKAAHIGVAMGARGTDVAREAASLVLLRDDFADLAHAVRLGRRIYDNIGKAMSFVIAVHVPIAAMALVPLLFGWPLLFLPIHVLFLEFIIDPVCSIAYEAEPEDPDLMRRPPRSREARLFSLRHVAASMLRGSGLLVATAALYGWALTQGTADQARAAAFSALVFGCVGLVLVHRTQGASSWDALRGRNPVLWWIVIGACAALVAVLAFAPARALFRFGELAPGEIAGCALVGLAGSAVVAVVMSVLRQLQEPAAS